MTRQEKQTKLADRLECMPEEMDRFSDNILDMMYDMIFGPHVPLTEAEIEYGKRLVEKINNGTHKPVKVIPRRLKH